MRAFERLLDTFYAAAEPDFRIYYESCPRVSLSNISLGKRGCEESFMPLPLPIFKNPPKRGVSKLQGVARRWTLYLLCYLNFLYLNAVGNQGNPTTFASASSSFSERQSEAVSRIYGEVESFIQGTPQHPPATPSEKELQMGMLAGPVIADKIDLPKVAASHCLRGAVGAGLREWIDREDFLQPAANLEGPLPVCPVWATRDEWAKVATRLIKSGLGEFIEEREIPRLDNGTPVLCGCFSVPKKDGRQRLIVNAVPLNMCMKPLRSAKGFSLEQELPQIGRLAYLIIREGQHLLINGDDASNYFYIWRLPDSLSRLFVFVKPIKRERLSRTIQQQFEGDFLYIRLRALPMGWCHSVSFAQSATQAIVANCLSSGSLVDKTLQHEALHILYIDDINTLKQVNSRNRETATQEQTGVRAAFLKREIDLNAKKGYLGQEVAEVLGLILDGLKGSLALSPAKKLSLIIFVLHLIKMETVPTKLYQRAVGRFIYVLQTKRPLYSIFRTIWEPLTGDETSMTIGETQKRELLTASVFLPLASADLRLPLHCTVSAADASDLGGGIVFQNYSYSTVLSLFSRVNLRGSVFLPKEAAGRLLARTLALTPQTDWNFYKQWKWPKATSGEHINLKEMRALLETLHWRVSKFGPHRCVHLIDNTVVLSIAGKGRSGSSLGKLMEGVAALCIAGSVQPVLIYCPTELMPADEASRVFPT